MMRIVYPGEVTHNVVAGPRSGIRGRPNFFGRGLRGLGEDPGDPMAAPLSVAAAAAKLASAQNSLANAVKQRRDCDKFSALDVIGGLLTMGGSTIAMKGACYVKWDAQVSFWEDRLAEAQNAMGEAQAAEAEQAAVAAQQAALMAAKPLKIPTKVGVGKGAMTSTFASVGGAVSGIPTWLKVAGGVVLLGGLAYGVSRYTKGR